MREEVFLGAGIPQVTAYTTQNCLILGPVESA